MVANLEHQISIGGGLQRLTYYNIDDDFHISLRQYLEGMKTIFTSILSFKLEVVVKNFEFQYQK